MNETRLEIALQIKNACDQHFQLSDCFGILALTAANAAMYVRLVLIQMPWPSAEEKRTDDVAMPIRFNQVVI